MNGSGNYSMLLKGENAESPPVKVDFLNLKKAAIILRSMNHKLRQQIIKLIDENDRLTVTEIYIRLRLEQSVASQHLAILRRAGMVKTIREGKFIYYELNVSRIRHLMRCVDDVVK